ncbi:sigma-70 family RNA polymerase sigma factor [Niallia sp. FSL W8-0635]|uniref:sigma-70 family RNA polymerase sigma factor n=1 Tax=Niallia sp. FSL W8-0635 TaxID=2975337 RepID=UPI0009D5CB81|nr:alternative RNA polymerase sigma factor SigM [Mycobacteroides abscessus subsp. abscessus]
MEELSACWNEIDNKEEVFDEIMITYGQELLHLVFSYVKNQTIAEELTQDIFVKVYYSLHKYKGKSSFRTWLWRIAINHCKDYLKSWYTKNVVKVDNEFLFGEDSSENVEEEILQKEEEQLLIQAVMNLPVMYREIIFLFYFEELPIKEIAAILKINENTIKTRLRRAKDLLKKIGDEQKWTNA